MTVEYRVVFRPAAESDLTSLYNYLSENSGHDRADTYVTRIERTCMALAHFPHRGVLREDILPGLRLLGFERRASIAFLVDADSIRILRIFYGGRDFPEDWDSD